MRKHVIPLFLFCCLLFVSAAHASDKKPKPKSTKARDYGCSYYYSGTGKNYCVETSAACTVAHAYVKESGSTASPVLIVLTLKSSSNGCLTFEGSLAIAPGHLIVVNVQTCDCGNNLSTHVFFVGDF